MGGRVPRLSRGNLIEQHLSTLAAHRNQVGDARAVSRHWVLPRDFAALRIKAVEVTVRRGDEAVAVQKQCRVAGI